MASPAKPRIALRAIEPEDIDTILTWENDTRSWTDSTTAAPFSRHNIETYALTYDPDIFSARQLRLIIDLDGQAVGAVDLFEFDPINRRAGVGIVVDPSFRRRGIGSEALLSLAAYCHERLGIHQLWAIVRLDNEPSRALFASAGFAAAGRLRSWLRVSGSSYTDALILQLLMP